MSSTQITVGFNENGKSNCKVLKPPGGGSSDIFGEEQQFQASGGMMAMSSKSGKNRMQSNIFAEPKNVAPKQADSTPRRVPGTGGADSHNRLFGEPDRNFTSSKNNLKSSIPIGGDATDGGKVTNGKTNGYTNGGSNGHASSNGNGHANGNGTSDNGHSNGNGYSNGDSMRKETYDLTPDSAYSTKSSTLSHASSSTNIDNPTYVSNIKSCIAAADTKSNTSQRSAVATPKARNPVTGNGISDSACRAKKNIGGGNRKDGNPVTGEGYKAMGNSTGAEINTHVPSLNGSMSQLPLTPSHVVNKNRIPPGGFSKGLW